MQILQNQILHRPSYSV